MLKWFKEFKEIFFKEESSHQDIKAIYQVLIYLSSIESTEEEIFEEKKAIWNLICSDKTFDLQHYDFLVDPILEDNGLIELSELELKLLCNQIKNMPEISFRIFYFILAILYVPNDPKDASEKYHDELSKIIFLTGVTTRLKALVG